MSTFILGMRKYGMVPPITFTEDDWTRLVVGEGLMAADGTIGFMEFGILIRQAFRRNQVTARPVPEKATCVSARVSAVFLMVMTVVRVVHGVRRGTWVWCAFLQCGRVRRFYLTIGACAFAVAGSHLRHGNRTHMLGQDHGAAPPDRHSINAQL